LLLVVADPITGRVPGRGRGIARRARPGDDGV